MIANSRLLKVILLGDPGVGKTALMKRYCTNDFNKSYQPTIGADFLTKELTIDDGNTASGQPITLQIWDTAGQERFKSLVTRFYRGSDACILVYDITKPDSFRRLEFWMEQFIEHADVQDSGKFPFLIVGNKQDLHQQGRVPEDEVRRWCASKGKLHFIQTSAKVDTNVKQAFERVVRLAIDMQPSLFEIYGDKPAAPINTDDFHSKAPKEVLVDIVRAQNRSQGSNFMSPSEQIANNYSSNTSTHRSAEPQSSFTLTGMQKSFETTQGAVSKQLESWECC